MKRRKIFVGAIGAMTEETFYNYFTKFGPVEDYIVFRDQATGRTKGFGFVVFRDA